MTVYWALLNRIKELYPTYYVALLYHRTHKNKRINIGNNLFLEEIYKDNSRNMVIQKSTQCGISEYLHCRTFTKTIQGKSVFYVLPTYDLMLTVVQNRINKELEFTDLYKQQRDQAIGDATSAKLKHIGDGVIKFVGSNTANAFIEFPADEIIIDELDNCDQSNILMAEERLGASENPEIISVSNPTYPGLGINELYNKSDKKLWHIICPKCKKEFNPDFFINVLRQVDENEYSVIDPNYHKNSDNEIDMYCQCGSRIDRYSAGRWIGKCESSISGYHISKLFSSQTTLKEIVDKYFESEKNLTLKQRFYNSELGLPYMSEGESISENMLNKCLGEHVTVNESENPCVLGLDIGKNRHNCLIAEIVDDKLKIVYIGILRNVEDIIAKYRQFNVKAAVVDEMPEFSIVSKLLRMKPWFACRYKTSPGDAVDARHKVLKINRTGILDTVREYIITERVVLPKNSQSVKGFYEQMMANIRIWDEKKEAYLWTEGNKDDHYFHSMAYLILAYKVLLLGRR